MHLKTHEFLKKQEVMTTVVFNRVCNDNPATDHRIFANIAKKMLAWIKKRRISVIFLLMGGLSGFLYWKFIGCTTGTCPLKSHWYTMTIYGLLMGWLIGDLISSFTATKSQK
jgi:hypothetical protein